MKTLSLVAALLLCSTASAQQYGFQQYGVVSGPYVVQVQRTPRILRIPMVIPTPYYQAYPSRPTITHSRSYVPTPRAAVELPYAAPITIDNPYFFPGVTK